LSDGWSTASRSPASDEKSSQSNTHNSRTSAHWGHVAVFYLVEQMHRWERFVFRFDKQFASMAALRSINGKSTPGSHFISSRALSIVSSS
jgi:hypothetical protein